MIGTYASEFQLVAEKLGTSPPPGPPLALVQHDREAGAALPAGRRLALEQHGQEAPGAWQAKALIQWVLDRHGRKCSMFYRRTPGFRHAVRCMSARGEGQHS